MCQGRNIIEYLSLGAIHPRARNALPRPVGRRIEHEKGKSKLAVLNNHGCDGTAATCLSRVHNNKCAAELSVLALVTG
jgi:hypothetical protein